MVHFKHNKIMKGYDVLVPSTLADERSEAKVASISEGKEPIVSVHRDVSVKLLRNILLAWEEFNYQTERAESREAEELNSLLNNNKKGDK